MMQNSQRDLFSRSRNLNERILDEGLHHLQSAQELLKRFPVQLFEPGGEFHHPGLWREYQEWSELLGCIARLDYQTYWRFEDWDKRCRQHVRRARWSKNKFVFNQQHEGDAAFKRFFAGAEAVRRHYQTLGLLPTATTEEIKAAYRRLATQHHPDLEGGDTGRMQQINVAYNELRRLRRF